MIQISTNEFRAKMAKTFNKVDAESEILLVKRKDNKNMVILPEREYNALAETAYLLASPANARALLEAFAQMERGETVEMTIDELKKEVGL